MRGNLDQSREDSQTLRSYSQVEVVQRTTKALAFCLGSNSFQISWLAQVFHFSAW